MTNQLKKIIEKITLAIKTFAYSTLTEENRNKLLKRKKDEIDDISFIEKEIIKEYKKEVENELEKTMTKKEIEKILNQILKEIDYELENEQ